MKLALSKAQTRMDDRAAGAMLLSMQLDGGVQATNANLYTVPKRARIAD